VQPSLRCHLVQRRWSVALTSSCLLWRLAKASYLLSQVFSLSHSETGTLCGSMLRQTAHGGSGSVFVEVGLNGVRKERLRLSRWSLLVGDGGAGRLVPLGTRCWGVNDVCVGVLRCCDGGPEAKKAVTRSFAYCVRSGTLCP
jgi:hypothetical protein